MSESVWPSGNYMEHAQRARSESSMCSPMPDDVCTCNFGVEEITEGDKACPHHGGAYAAVRANEEFNADCQVHREDLFEDIAVGDEVTWTLFEAKDMENTRPLTMSGRVTASLIQDNGVAVVHVTDESSSRGYWIVAIDSLRRTVTAEDAESTPETLTGD